MKLTLGPPDLQKDFEFEIFKKSGPYTTVEGRLGLINKVGVYVSGGIDSMALLCMVLTELRDTGRLESTPVICFTIAKSDGPTYYVPRLLQKVEEHFNVKLTHVNDIPNDPEPDKTGDMGADAINVVRKYAPNMVTYMGINRMAPDDIRPFKQRLRIDYGYSTTSKNFSAPLLFLHKPHILDIIYQLGCGDLLPYTHSCTVLPDGACGECYSCAERKWGFDALGKIDPGTILPKLD